MMQSQICEYNVSLHTINSLSGKQKKNYYIMLKLTGLFKSKILSQPVTLSYSAFFL